MMIHHELDGLDMTAATLEKEWQVTVESPNAGVEGLLSALGRELPLRQGPYDNCLYVRDSGYQRFRALEGSHAGSEDTVQQTPASQVVFAIPADQTMLRKAFDVIFAAHVNEEPTIRITEVWGSRSKLLDDKANPNRYWNRADAATVHGRPVD